jgi:primosomal protein N'
MQYANVIIDHRAGHRPLTYSIPPHLLAHVTLGSVVRVPFGRTSVSAVISGFVRHVDPLLESKLKPITEVIQPGHFVADYILEAAHELHQQYGLRLGETLFSLLPPFLKTRQTTNQTPLSLFSPGYRAIEYQIPMERRITLLRSLLGRMQKKNVSLLIIVASKSSAESLAQLLQTHAIPVISLPSPASPAKLRRFFEATEQLTTSSIVIGTRSALIASLHRVGAIVIDEPWLPGHKSDTYPKSWSIMTGQALAKQRKIPLILLTTTQWSESHLICRPSYNIAPVTGKRNYIERTNISEILLYFYEQTKTHPNRAIVFRADKTQQRWCPRCQIHETREVCPQCYSATYQFPSITEQTLLEMWTAITPRDKIALIQLDAVQQFHHYDALLLLNIDNLLHLVDYRISQYLKTVIGLAQGQSETLYIATRRQAEWISILNQPSVDPTYAREHHLPPYGLPVELTAAKKTTITLALTAVADPIMSPITPFRDGFRCIVHCRPPLIPRPWLEIPNLNINPLPLYIEKLPVSGTSAEKTV